ncbi:C69 family dipeptidase [Ruegeria pomeroyi]|nr:C69 family dipeptidase [Ruegeria pomeroyi]
MSYGIYIGKNHAADGHAWLAGYGDEPSSHWLEIVPRQTHAAGATITVGMTPEADLPGRLTEIPQVRETARHLRVSYSYYLGVPAPLTNGGLNEYGVAVRDIWSPSRPELIAMTPAGQTGPNYSDLARIVMERARSAREGVDIIAALIAEHGYSCYGGNSHIIADEEEAWVVIEFAGGLGLWVAERLGPDSIRASRPGYIGRIPDAPNADFRFPAHFVSTAVEKGWHDPKSGPFDVNVVYGDGKGRWQGVQWVEAEMRKRAERPEKISLADIIWAIATEKLTGDTAGYGQVVPLRDPGIPSLRMFWHAPVGAVTAPMVPVFMGQMAPPPEYGPHRYLTTGESARFLDNRNEDASPERTSRVRQGQEVTRSAFQTYKRLMHLAFQIGESALTELWDHWRTMESRLASELAGVTRAVQVLTAAGEEDLAADHLTRYSNRHLIGALQDAEALAAAYEARLRNAGKLNVSTCAKVPKQIW